MTTAGSYNATGDPERHRLGHAAGGLQGRPRHRRHHAPDRLGDRARRRRDRLGDPTVTATAADNVGVAGVQFLLDGANLGAEDTTAPYSIPWDTTGATNGSHSLTARARDAAGNSPRRRR